MIDNSLNIPVLHQECFSVEDNNYITVLNKEVERLMELNPDCWGKLNTSDDTWSTYPINKDILFNNEIFDQVSIKIKDIILQYAMSVKADTQRHQVHLLDSTIYVSHSNLKPYFKSDDSQHFVGYLFLHAENSAGNIIIKNPLAPKRHFHHNGGSPLQEYFIRETSTGDVVILPSHIEHKMSDFSKKTSNELRVVEFGITVA